MDRPAHSFFSKLFFVPLALFLFSAAFSSVYAATDNQTTGVVVPPQITVENLKIGDRGADGARIPLKFTLHNIENRTTYDIGYRIYVLGAGGEVYLVRGFPRLYFLGAFETKDVEVVVEAPKGAVGGDLKMRVVATSPSGLELGDQEAAFSVGGETAFVTLTTSEILVDGKASSAPDAATLDAGQKVAISILAKSQMAALARIKYMASREENFNGNVVSGPEVKLVSGQNRYGFELEGFGTAVGNFVVYHWLEDEGGKQISALKKIYLGVWGVYTTINYLTLDKYIAGAEESVDVEVALVPILSRENFGKVRVRVWVDGSSGEGEVDFEKSATTLVNVPLKNGINRPAVRVQVEKDGVEILDYKTSVETREDQGALVEVVPEVSNRPVIGLVAFAVIFVVTLVFVAKRRRAPVVVFLLLGFMFLFFAKSDSLATFNSGSSYVVVPSISGPCSPASSYFYVSSFLLYKNGSGTAASQNEIFRPGDTIRFKGNMNSGAGSCTYFGSGTARHRIGSVELGSTSGQSWDRTFTVPGIYDNISYKSTSARTTWTGDIRSQSTAGRVESWRSMTITMGPQAVDVASLSVALPSCSSGNYNATFNFTGRALAENYDVEWATDAAFTANFGRQTFAGGGGAKSYATTGTPYALANTYYWRVVAYNSNANSAVTTVALATFGPLSECPPANPSSLSVSTSCNNGLAEVQFTFTDNSTNEDWFWLDVNGADWTGASSPVPWGYKNISRTVAEVGGVGPVTFLWTDTDNMDAGDVDPVLGGSQLVPAENKTYYWRVKAGNGTVGDSSHVYPPNSASVPGSSFTTPDCPDTPYDLSASIVPLSWRNNVGVTTQSFEPGSNATLEVEVVNNSPSASSATKLYFYYRGSGLPNCISNPDGTLSPSSTPATSPPLDGANADQGYNVGPIAAGGAIEVNVSFAVGPVETTATAYAYVVPSCSFLPGSGLDPVFDNNRSGGFSYTVSTDKFFETRGGDVGAGGNIDVGFDSSTITSPGPQYQSDYIVAAQTVGPKVSSRSNQILTSYTRGQVPSGGIFDYLYSRIKAGSYEENCGMGIGSGLVKICDATERTFSTTGPQPDALPSGDFVMVVEGDLRIADNVILPSAASTATFIVQGSITVELDVTRMDGIYIAKRGFSDSEILNAGVGPTGFLTVNGGLYVDCEEGGTVSLGRYFAPPWTINNIYPSNVFKFEPKYLLKLQSLIGVSPIVWREVGP